MAARTIAFDPLDPASIGHAIAGLNKFRNDLLNSCNEVLTNLAEQGGQNAERELRAMIPPHPLRTYDIENQLYYTQATSANRVASVVSNVDYAGYVEYGTGVVGASMGHPMAAKEGWAYDIHGHDVAGWTYHNDRDGKWHNTAGYYARPFMYMTKLFLASDAVNQTQKVFANF